MFVVKKISFVSPAYDVLWASVLEYSIKLRIIWILCTIPCSMGRVRYSQPLKTYMYAAIDTLDQYWIYKNQYQG